MPARPRVMWIIAASVTLVLVVTGGVLWRNHTQSRADDEARAAVQRTADAIVAGDVSRLAFAGTSGSQAQQRYSAATKALGKAATAVRVHSFARDGDRATATLSVSRSLPGGATWTYDLPLHLRHTDAWRIPADQALIHPDLAADETLRLRRDQPPRADVLGDDGKPLVSLGDVIDVGIQRSRITGDVGQLARSVAGIVDVDAAALTKRVTAAGKDSFVDVITLRRSDYTAVRSRLRPLPGVVFRERKQSLAPTREFARALLGTVGPVTAEIVKESKGRYVAGDVAGVSGLQRQYDEQLAGTAGTTVEAVPADDGGDARQLFRQEAVQGKPLRVTLDKRIQEAADAALAATAAQVDNQPAALVAVDVRTGAVLAVANTPVSGLDRAVVGKYPPGSTFKIVTTLSLLQKGLRPSDTVNCPPTATVGGRTFKNYESEKLGPVPFRTDFAKSCNTAFVGLSKRLDDDDLQATAKQLGIGADWNLGTSAFSGSVPRNESDVDKAAAAFGQGRTEVSPLALAVATASVARGAYVSPTLVVPEDGPATPDPQPLPKSAVGTLQSLMRDVVTSGTGTVLRSVPGGPVHAKTGTAEFGSAKPPKTRAWITGWQGNVAFTAFVEEGKSGGTVAGPVAAKFLELLAE